MNDGSPPDDFDPPPRLQRMAANDGTNPFREDVAIPPPSDGPSPTDHLFAGPGGPFTATPTSDNYEMILPHRGTVVFIFGLFGLLGATIGSLGLFCCLPFPMFALALSIPAWLMGRMDLKAIDAGAMDKSGRGSTFSGFVMGIVGTILASLICLGFGGWVIWDMFRGR